MDLVVTGDLLKTLRALASALFRHNVLPLGLLDALFLSSFDLEFKNFKNENIMSYTNLGRHDIKAKTNKLTRTTKNTDERSRTVNNVQRV